MLVADDIAPEREAAEILFISNNNAPHDDVLADADFSAFDPNNDIPRIESVKHAHKVLDTLLGQSPHAIGCIYHLDDLHFGEMRSNVLRAGIIALAVQAGYRAIVVPISERLSPAHWRSEFIFRAVRGIRQIKPEITEQELCFIVMQAIHFHAQHLPDADDLSDANWSRVMPRVHHLAH